MNSFTVAPALNTLEEYRMKIRETDKQILSLIKERLGIGGQVADIKHGNGLPTIDPDAEKATMDSLTQSGAEIGLDPSFARRLGELLIDYSKEIEAEGGLEDTAPEEE